MQISWLVNVFDLPGPQILWNPKVGFQFERDRISEDDSPIKSFERKVTGRSLQALDWFDPIRDPRRFRSNNQVMLWFCDDLPTLKQRRFAWDSRHCVSSGQYGFRSWNRHYDYSIFSPYFIMQLLSWRSSIDGCCLRVWEPVRVDRCTIFSISFFAISFSSSVYTFSRIPFFRRLSFYRRFSLLGLSIRHFHIFWSSFMRESSEARHLFWSAFSVCNYNSNFYQTYTWRCVRLLCFTSAGCVCIAFPVFLHLRTSIWVLP
jgi:hypothetical protein